MFDWVVRLWRESNRDVRLWRECNRDDMTQRFKTEVYLEPCQTSMIRGFFVKIVDGF